MRCESGHTNEVQEIGHIVVVALGLGENMVLELGHDGVVQEERVPTNIQEVLNQPGGELERRGLHN